MAKRRLPPGPGVDYFGSPVLDPTANVIALNEAANKRQDDLRELNTSWMEKIATLRAEHAQEIVTLHAGHDRVIHDSEASRLDAIRQIDVSAVLTAAQEAQTAIRALAAQTSNTAATFAVQIDQRFGQLSDRIAALEKSSYEGQGKGAGIGAVWTVILGGGGLLVTLIAVGTFIFAGR